MKLRFGICGAGYIAKIHADAIKKIPNAELVAVVELFPEIASAFALKHSIKNTYSHIEDLLKRAEVDAVVIGTPNALHAPQALAVINSGLPVLIEKPLAMDSQEASQILEASKKNNVPLMVGHCWRFDVDVNWLKDKVTAGLLGDIYRTKGYGVHVNWGPSGWFTQKVLAGGGALADMGIHAIDTVRYLMGDPQPSSVYARIGTYYIDSDVDDTGVILVNWENGVTSYIESGWWQPHMDGPEAATQLYGHKGFGSLFPTKLEIPNLEEQRVDEINPGFIFPREEHCPQEMYDRQMAYFVECICDGITPVPGGKEGLVNMQIVDAAYESSRTGKVIDIKS